MKVLFLLFSSTITTKQVINRVNFLTGKHLESIDSKQLIVDSNRRLVEVNREHPLIAMWKNCPHDLPALANHKFLSDVREFPLNYKMSDDQYKKILDAVKTIHHQNLPIVEEYSELDQKIKEIIVSSEKITIPATCDYPKVWKLWKDCEGGPMHSFRNELQILCPDVQSQDQINLIRNTVQLKELSNAIKFKEYIIKNGFIKSDGGGKSNNSNDTGDKSNHNDKNTDDNDSDDSENKASDDDNDNNNANNSGVVSGSSLGVGSIIGIVCILIIILALIGILFKCRRRSTSKTTAQDNTEV